MISPHPPRLRMKRRNTVSVTPAMGAKTVAGSIGIFPIITLAGTVATARARTPAPTFAGFSQYLRTVLFYRLPQVMQLWHNCSAYRGYDMDDTPGHFLQELRSSLLKKRAGQIALAVILAEACLRFLNALTWFLVVPIIAMVMKGHSESVLFERQTRAPFPWQPLFGSLLDFTIALIFVFYLNRWIHRT